MGTNYYVILNPCPHCGRGDERLHIGKQSYGWVFSWHGMDKWASCGEICSRKQWLDFLNQPGRRIEDEYGGVWTVEQFMEHIQTDPAAKRSDGQPLSNHARMYPEGCWVDEEGQSFSSGEFS